MQTFDAVAPADAILLVVAHYDDEVIGVGGQLTRWAARTTIVHVTDSAPADGLDARAAGFGSPEAYGAARRREFAAALSCLSQPVRATLALDILDRGVTDRVHDVIASVAQIVERIRPALVVTHAYEGGHPDHDAVSFAMHAVRAMPQVPPFELLEFAAYHEGPDGQLVTNRFANEPSASLRLSADERRLKRLMLAQYATQARVLAAFACREESVRRAARADFTVPPPCGRVWFERLGWGVTGASWRASMADAARRIGGEGLTC